MADNIAVLEDMFSAVQAGEVSGNELCLKILNTGQVWPKNEMIVFTGKLFDWALTKADQFPDIYGFALLVKARTDFILEHFESALKNTASAQLIFEDLNHTEGLSFCKLSLAAVYRSLGDIDLALKCFTEVWEVISHDKTYDFYHIIVPYNLAEIYAESNHLDASIKYYQYVIENGRVLDYLFPIFLSGIAMVYHRQHQELLAGEYLEKALQLCHELNAIPTTFTRVLTELGTWYFDQGNYAEAIEKHQQSLKIREDASILGGAVTNMLQIAKIYSIQGKDLAGIEMLHRALEMAESVNVKPKIAQVHQMLSMIYEKLGDSSRSLHHFKEYFRINEEVNFEDAEKKVKNTLIIFEAAHTRQENALIKAQKKEIELKNTELQDTIDELTLTRINRKAKAISFSIAIALFIVEDTITHFFVAPFVKENFLVSLCANGLIIFSIKPIEKLIEHFLLQKFVIRKKSKPEITVDLP